ncbi:MAG: integral membrane protein mpv17 pmp22 family [Piptocephalis tieghemiana]|nr:MAG: integral membrane protein mpv17 pmp22 family [Piptocephalis tieghemiana]
MPSLLRFYQKSLRKSPLLTQSLVTGGLFAFGDVLAQQGVEKKGVEAHDLMRTARMLFFGTAFAGPVLGTWYRLLDQRIRLSTPGKTLLARVFVDQLCGAPVIIASFFTGLGFLAGDSRKTILGSLKKGYPEALKNNYKLWPAVQLFNFHFVPLQHRLLLTNTVALGWNTYISYETSRHR